MSAIRNRGRPPKVKPFFSDTEAERMRVEACRIQHSNPYPPFKHKPCKAERILRKSIMPGVPFRLVLELNNCDDEGRPHYSEVAELAWEKAQLARQSAAQSGAAMKLRPRSTKLAVAEHHEDILRLASKGQSRSSVRRFLNIIRGKSGNRPIGRSEFYKQLDQTGIWPK